MMPTPGSDSRGIAKTPELLLVRELRPGAVELVQPALAVNAKEIDGVAARQETVMDLRPLAVSALVKADQFVAELHDLSARSLEFIQLHAVIAHLIVDVVRDGQLPHQG